MGDFFCTTLFCKQKKIIIIENIPEECLFLFGGGKIKPVQLIGLPLIYSEKVVGVMEIGALRKIGGRELEWIKKAADIIAVELFVMFESEKLKKAFEKKEFEEKEPVGKA